MNIDYEKIQQSVNKYGNYILSCIKNQYGNSLTQEQLQNVDSLLNSTFIIIDKPSNYDMEFFNKQVGINDSNNYSINNIPSAHGGRTKGDNKIHIYPYTKSFKDCKTDEEIIKLCVDDIVVHEIFHYIIRPNISNETETIKDEFGHFLTEGLVQYYAEEFAKKYRLGGPKSNYGKNVEFVKQLIQSFPNNLTQEQIDKIVFTYNQDELINISENGKTMYEKYVGNIQFKEQISSLITSICTNMGIDNEKLYGILSHYKKVDDVNVIYNDLSNNIELGFKNDETKKAAFTQELNNIISDKKLKDEMTRYESKIKSILPIEEQIKSLKKTGKSNEEIKSILADDSFIFDYIPNTLYHGSPENLDVINPNESTQKGSNVYATDNPIHALFFSIFRNSSIARAHIDEHINDNGEYQVKYYIDERVKGALDEIITDKNITIHVCDGSQFLKPQGEAYINREWISKNGQSIVPTDKIQVNVKHFFDSLEQRGLVEYDRYDKSKDWKTVIDMLGQNYPFGLGTDKGKDIEKFDSMYDEFIGKNYPEQFEFSQKFRGFAKDVMATNYKSQNPNMSLEDENNYKLKYIKDTANSFLNAKKDENGKVKWSVNTNKMDMFMNPENFYEIEERGKSR